MFCVVSSPNINTIYFKILHINDLNKYDNIQTKLLNKRVGQTNINTCRVPEFKPRILIYKCKQIVYNYNVKLLQNCLNTEYCLRTFTNIFSS